MLAMLLITALVAGASGFAVGRSIPPKREGCQHLIEYTEIVHTPKATWNAQNDKNMFVKPDPDRPGGVLYSNVAMANGEGETFILGVKRCAKCGELFPTNEFDRKQALRERELLGEINP